MTNYDELDKIIAISKYREQAKQNLMINFPTLTEGEVDTALDIILSNAYKKRECLSCVLPYYNGSFAFNNHT